jgi:uncharacterized Zn-binding protein involved in type VI secretion
MNLALVLVTASMVTAQATSSNYEHLKEYGDMMVGTWQTEWPAEFAVPGLAEKGDMISVETTIEWALDNNVIVGKSTVTINGKEIATGMRMTGWDKSAKRIVGSSFSSLGVRSESVIEKRGDKWYVTGRGVGLDGSATANTSILTVKDKDTHQWLWVGRLNMEGEPIPNKEVIYKRVK